MSVLQDLTSQVIQEGHVDKLTLVMFVHLLHSVWVALNTVEYVAGHWLIGLVETLLSMHTIEEGKVLMVTMWMACLLLMELLVHASTFGHLLVASTLKMGPTHVLNVHVIMATPTLHLAL